MKPAATSSGVDVATNDADVTGRGSGDGGDLGENACEEKERQRDVVLTMDDLVLEPPALASEVSGDIVLASSEQSHVFANRKRSAHRKGSTGAAMASGAATEVERHLDHVLEALVRARAIALPRSRLVS